MVGREAVVSISSLGKAIVGEPVEVACNVDDEVSTEHSLGMTVDKEVGGWL